MAANLSETPVQDAFYAAKASASQHYRAATPGRGTPRPAAVPTYGVSADYWLEDETKYWYLVELARYFLDNDPILSAALKRVADNVIGCGFAITPTTSVAEVDDYLEADWRRWSATPDASDTKGERDLHERCHAELMSVLTDGDVFAVPRANGTIQTLEAHRCRTSRATKKNVVLGIEEDNDGRRTSYWLTRNENDLWYKPTVAEIEQVPARDAAGNRRVWQYYLPLRTTARRGVSVIAPIAEFLQMHGDVQYGKLFQQQAASAIAFFHELPVESFNLMTPEQQTMALEALKAASESPNRTLKAGLDLWPRFPGEKLQGFSPNIPNQEFFQHVMLILQIVSINLGLPLQILLLDPTATNFSGWRGAKDEAQRGFSRLQKHYGRRWYMDKYGYRIRYLLHTRPDFVAAVVRAGWRADDIIRDPAHPIYDVRISPPKSRYIEPTKDIQARVSEVGNHLVAPSEDAAAWGGDFWQTVDTTVQDNVYGIRAAKRAAAEINQEFPDDADRVTWRDIWSPITSDATSVSLSRTLDEPTQPTEQGAPTNAVSNN